MDALVYSISHVHPSWIQNQGHETLKNLSTSSEVLGQLTFIKISRRPLTDGLQSSVQILKPIWVMVSDALEQQAYH